MPLARVNIQSDPPRWIGASRVYWTRTFTLAPGGRIPPSPTMTV